MSGIGIREEEFVGSGFVVVCGCASDAFDRDLGGSAMDSSAGCRDGSSGGWEMIVNRINGFNVRFSVPFVINPLGCAAGRGVGAGKTLNCWIFRRRGCLND